MKYVWYRSHREVRRRHGEPCDYFAGHQHVPAWRHAAPVRKLTFPVGLREQRGRPHGRLPCLFFYLVCGVGAGVAHVLVNWGSRVPSIGASGAISGVMGTYIVLPFSKTLTLVPLLIFFFTVRLPAMLMLGYWFAIQFLSGLGSLGQVNQGGVAWWAHVGGFLLGALIVVMMPRDG